MKFLPLLGDKLSGSIGGITASHNRGGAYFRQRVTPVNTNTVKQQAVRGAMAQLSNFWGSVLTPSQRDAWNVYAFNVPLVDPIGEPRNVGGLGMYNRGNVARLQAALPRVDSGPIVFNLGEFTQPTGLAITTIGQTFDFDITNTDEWANEDDAALQVYVSRPTSVTRNFFKGPYRFAGQVLGDSITPPLASQTVPLPFFISPGQRVHVRFAATRADGRRSGDFRAFADS